jgi:16S rRNA (cytosine967-C5)-methyltransferase
MPLGGLAAFKEGLVEVQDEGSQIAALLVGAGPGMRVVDFCAGVGGKTLALAAGMENRGKLVACDVSARRLERAVRRLRRAGVNNVERRVLSGERDKWVKRHAGGFDRVLVDAPCLGTGTWRRNPDGKWRATPNDLAELVVRQHDILHSAARLVRRGGRLVYATCSLLREEDEAQAEAFLMAEPEFSLVPAARAWAETIGGPSPGGERYLRLTPAQHGTDGFFVAIFDRRTPDPSPDDPSP